MKKIFFVLFLFLYWCNWSFFQDDFLTTYKSYLDQFDLNFSQNLKQDVVEETLQLDLTWSLSWYTGNATIILNNFYQNDNKEISSNLLFSGFVNNNIYKINYDLLDLNSEKFIFIKDFLVPDIDPKTILKYTNTRLKINTKKEVLNKTYIYVFLKAIKEKFINIKSDLKNYPLFSQAGYSTLSKDLNYNIKLNRQNFYNLQNKYNSADVKFNITWNMLQTNSWIILNLKNFEFGNFFGSGTLGKYAWNVFLYSQSLKNSEYLNFIYTGEWDNRYDINVNIYNLKEKIWYLQFDILKVHLEKWIEINIKGEVKIKLIDVNFVLKYRLSDWNQRELKSPDFYQDIEKLF